MLCPLYQLENRREHRSDMEFIMLQRRRTMNWKGCKVLWEVEYLPQFLYNRNKVYSRLRQLLEKRWWDWKCKGQREVAGKTQLGKWETTGSKAQAEGFTLTHWRMDFPFNRGNWGRSWWRQRETLKNAGEMWVFSPTSLCFLCEMEHENDGDHSTIPSGGKGQVTR